MATPLEDPPLPDERTVQLPAKLANTNTIRHQGRHEVLLNGFSMNLQNAAPILFQYKLTFCGENQKGPKELHKGPPNNDFAKETRRRLLWHLFQHLLRTNANFFGTNKYIYVYDCGDTLFTTRDFGLEKDEQKEFGLDIDRNSLEERCRCYIRPFDRLKAHLINTATVQLRNAVDEIAQGKISATRFLDLLSTQHILEQGRHYIFGNRMLANESYEVASTIRLHNDPHILKKGMLKNVRLVGDNKQDAHPMLQIEPKASPFYPETELLEYLREFFGSRNVQHFAAEMNKFWEQTNRQLKYLVLETTHLPHDQLNFSAHGITHRSATELEFTLDDGEWTTVVRYYEVKYVRILRFPQLPCVVQRKGQKEFYFPMELLRIVPGQRVSLDKQTPYLKDQVMRYCCVVPADMPDQVDEQFNTAMGNNNQFFNAFGVQIERQMLIAESQMLHPPAIQYGDPMDKVEPERGSLDNWRTIGRDVPPNRKFFRAAQFPKTWVVIIVQNCVSNQDCQNFTQLYMRTAKRREMVHPDFRELPPRVDHFAETNIEYVQEKFKFYARQDRVFALMFAPGKKDAHTGDIHQIMKFMEEEHHIFTQHISPEIMHKCMNKDGGAAMVLENILMKTNERLEGINWDLATSRAFINAVRDPTNTIGNLWLGCKRMIIGISMSHASPQSLFERQAGVRVAVPTVVGMAYTVGKHMLKMRSTHWTQTARQTTMDRTHVQPLVEHIKLALKRYKGENGFFPLHLIVYRGGASEGEFKRISAWEGYAFEKAFAELAREEPDDFKAAPAVTIVVCQRNTNYRTFPPNTDRRLKSKQQNLQPGTVIDRHVMSPFLTEFLLTAHYAQQGTVQPVRCTVVHEYRPKTGTAARFPPIPLEELENITFILCFSTAKFAGSTAEPGVLCKADKAAKVGQQNWKIRSMLRQQEEDVPPEAPADGGNHEHEQPAEEANI